MTRIVYGVEEASIVLAVELRHYDPVTGEAGNCGQVDSANAQTKPGTSHVTYFAFDAPAGHYLVTAPLIKDGSSHFLAPAGHSVYVGTFFWDGTVDYNGFRVLSLRRDLDAAIAAIGAPGVQMQLAPGLPNPTFVKALICTP